MFPTVAAQAILLQWTDQCDFGSLGDFTNFIETTNANAVHLLSHTTDMSSELKMYQPLGWYPKFCTVADFPFSKILNAVCDAGALHTRVSETQLGFN